MIHKERLKKWLDRVYEEPVEKDNSCLAHIDKLPAYVDAVVQGQSANGGFTDIREHLDSCQDCANLYCELVHIAALEENEQLPEVEALLAKLAGEETAVPTV